MEREAVNPTQETKEAGHRRGRCLALWLWESRLTSRKARFLAQGMTMLVVLVQLSSGFEPPRCTCPTAEGRAHVAKPESSQGLRL